MPLTQSDLQAIKELFNTETLVLRQDIKEIKEEVGGLREAIQAMSISIDKLVKGVEDLKQEYSLVVFQINKHEKWIRQIAEKVGVHLLDAESG